MCLVDQSRRYAASAAERWPAAQLSEEEMPPGFVRYVELEGTQHAFCLPNYTASPKTVRRPTDPHAHLGWGEQTALICPDLALSSLASQLHRLNLGLKRLVGIECCRWRRRCARRCDFSRNSAISPSTTPRALRAPRGCDLS